MTAHNLPLTTYLTTDSETRLAALREVGLRPFEQGVVLSPWSAVIDAEFYKDVKDHLRNTVGNGGISTEDRSRCATIIAAPGQGKTHLLAYVRQEMDRENGSLFIYVPPVLADDLPLPQHLVRATVDSLLSQSSRNKERFTEALQQQLVDVYDTIILKHPSLRRCLNLAWNPLGWFWPRMRCIGHRGRYEQREALQRAFQSRAFFEHAFQQFRARTNPEGKGARPDFEAFVAASLATCGNTQQRWYAERWFHNAFDPPEVREPYHLAIPCGTDPKARDTLFTLQKLAARPFILAYDQLEDTLQSYQRAGRSAVIGNHLGWVVDTFFTLSGFAQLFAVQKDVWYGEALASSLQTQARQRMTAAGGELELGPLTDAMACEIVRARMARLAWCPEKGLCPPDDNPLFPFTVEEIHQLRRDANSELRTFIGKVHAAYRQKLYGVAPPPVENLPQLRSIFPVEALSHEPTRVTILGERLPFAIEVYFGTHPGQHLTAQPEAGKIEVTTPTGVSGPVEVRVLNAETKQELGRLSFTFTARATGPLCDRVDRRRMRARREELGLTQTDVAVKVGTKQSRISCFERHKSGLDDAEVQGMAEMYGMPIQELLKRDGA